MTLAGTKLMVAYFLYWTSFQWRQQRQRVVLGVMASSSSSSSSSLRTTTTRTTFAAMVTNHKPQQRQRQRRFSFYNGLASSSSSNNKLIMMMTSSRRQLPSSFMFPRYNHPPQQPQQPSTATAAPLFLSSNFKKLIRNQFFVLPGYSSSLHRTSRSNNNYNMALFSSSSSSSSSSTTAASEMDATSTVDTATTSLPSSSSLSSPRRIKTKDATAALLTEAGEVIKIQGWVRTVRKQKTLAFIEVNDGSNLAGIQCVFTFGEEEENTNNNENGGATNNMASMMKQQLDLVTTGCAVEIHGPLVKSQGGKQAVEVRATYLQVMGLCPADTYPLAKKRHSLEYLRSLAHLRPRTNTIAAVARVRSTLAGAIHAYYQQQGFVYVQTPLITASDCEGAGELFRVTTLDMDHISQLPRKKSDPPTTISSDQVDYTQDFFGKPAYLTVSGQLGAETHACALGDVYTFGPTFRAENSQTTRHLAEFHMVEPEMAFCDLVGAMDQVELMLQQVVSHVLTHCREDLEFFQKFYDDQLVSRLTKLTSQPFARVSYRQAIQYLQDEIQQDPSKWQYPHVEFGTDLATEHERWLAECKFESAVFVYNYPKQIKAFYMRDNDEDAGETVHAMDLLVPGVGELVGGSQREERLEKLEQKMKDLNLNPADYWWYLDLRRYGSIPHAGYGLGFERLVTYVCGLENIREAIAFPRYPGNAEF